MQTNKFFIIPPPFDCWTKNKTPKKGPHFKSELEITPSPVIYLFQSIYNMETMIQSFSPSRVHPPLLSCSRVQVALCSHCNMMGGSY